MNLTNLGLAGLNAAQSRLMTSGHNINNAATPGFNRQSVLVSTAGAQSTGSGYIGRGVQVDSVQRAYDGFLFRQLVSAQTTGASLASYGNEIVQINNLFADRTVGISPALQRFFDGVQAVASAPADAAARQELLGRAGSLVGQINDANAFLNAQRENINTQIATVVTQINSHVERVHDLNRQITIAKATQSGQPPNDLLDQRDQVIAELSQLVDVRVLEQDGRVNLTVGNGQVLLGGDTVFPLHATESADDPSRTVVAYTAISGASGATISVQLREEAIKGGSLGGLMNYRSQALDLVQNDLGRMAAGLAIAINSVHANGHDLNGVPGAKFFTLGDPKVIRGAGNGSTAEITATFNLGDAALASKLTVADYRIEFDGTDFTVTSLPDRATVYKGATLSAAVMVPSLDITGVPVAGDSWLVQPARALAGDIRLELTDPARIAAASVGAGPANGGNALGLANLQTAKILGSGTMSFNESFSQIVNKVGVLTQQNSTASKAQSTLIQQNFAAQQAVSGVNLNEEYVNLDRYQEQFRAASRLIDVSATLFDTLLSLRT